MILRNLLKCCARSECDLDCSNKYRIGLISLEVDDEVGDALRMLLLIYIEWKCIS